MSVLEPIDVVQLEKYLTDGDNSGKLMVVEFFYIKGSFCKDNEGVLAEMAARHKHVKFIRVDAEKLKIHIVREKINSYPTYKFYKDGFEEDAVVYANHHERTLDGKKLLELRDILEKRILRYPDCNYPESKDSDSKEKKGKKKVKG